MWRTLASGAALTLVLTLALAGCGAAGASTAPGSSSATSDLQHQADLAGIEQIEVNWHKAASTKDLDLMMSLWADDATFTIGTDTLTGREQIRNFFATTAAPFKPENTWVSDTPAYKIRATVNGDKGTLYFECHYVDADPNSKTFKMVRSVVAADQTVARINGKWVISSSTSASPVLEP